MDLDGCCNAANADAVFGIVSVVLASALGSSAAAAFDSAFGSSVSLLLRGV